MTAQQLPEGWQMVKFGDIAQHISKRVEPSETKLNIYVGLEHLDPESLKIQRHGVPSDVAGQKLLVKKGQIIFGKRRAYQRKIAVADWDCICSAHAMVLEAKSDKVIPGFLPFFMQSDVFMNRAVSISEGSLSPTIKWGALERQIFRFPGKKEQQRLLTILTAIEKAATDNETVLESANLLLKKLLGNTLIKNKKQISISDVCEIISGQHIESSLYDANPAGTPYLTGPDDFPDGKIVLTKYTKSPKAMCRKGDVLLTVKGAGVGKCVIADGDYCISRQLMAVRSEQLDPFMVYLLVKAVSAELNAAAAGVIPGISKPEIAKFKISDIRQLNTDHISSAFSKILDVMEVMRRKKQEHINIKSLILD